ncbi:MAG: prepilin-type N-terminal cleavage/methylation domain-containing protein [Coriobacteriia bacterium]|nr:prepilin-type N-terminal cleavage/methylation domain-containing protein [Coriobacteriia bacterium]
MPRTDDGFSLVELLIVLAIMGVIVAIAIASFTANTSVAARVACLSNQRTLTQAVTQYQAAHDGRRPAVMDDLEPYARTFARARRCAADGRPLVLDEAGVVLCTHPGHDG